MGDIAAHLTAMVLTFNEEANIERCLNALGWVERIVVIDSGSVDSTRSICARFPNVEVYSRAFTTHAEQCNFGLEKVESTWVLSLDADYLVTEALAAEIRALSSESSISGYRAPFRYCVDGYVLRSTLLPPRCVLYRKACASYIDDGHAHRVEVDGRISTLQSALHHDDRKSLSRWLQSQLRYSDLEKEKLLATAWKDLSFSDKIRRQIIFAPLLMFFYCLFWKGLILDGWFGFYYTSQRVFAELLLALRLMEHKTGIVDKR